MSDNTTDVTLEVLRAVQVGLDPEVAARLLQERAATAVTTDPPEPAQKPPVADAALSEQDAARQAGQDLLDRMRSQCPDAFGA